MPQARRSAGLRRSALLETPLRWTKGGCCSLCTYTRDQAKKPRHPPGSLPDSALLTCSSCQPPSDPSCAERTATSRSAPPFPAFPGLHAHHPQNKQTPGRASPPASLPQSPTRAAPAHSPARRQQAPPTPGHAQARNAR